MSVSSKSTDRVSIDTKLTASSLPSVQATGTAQPVRVISPTRTDITVTQVNITAHTNSQSLATTANGPSAPPNRASPVPNQANVPNGKPASPLVATSNAMTNGGTQAPQTVTSKDPKAAAQAASDMRNIVRRKLTGYVGFANLPNQWHRKSVRKGFNFNVMVVGEST
jgi:septin 7